MRLRTRQLLSDPKTRRRFRQALGRLHRKDRRLSPEEPAQTRAWARIIRRGVTAKEISTGATKKIIDRLNNESNSSAVGRVSTFIELIQRATELNGLFRLFFETKDDLNSFFWNRPTKPKLARYRHPKDEFSSGWTFKRPEMQTINDELNATLRELNRLASRYRWHPFIRHQGFEFEELEVTESWKGRSSKNPDAGWETYAIWWLCSTNGKWINHFRCCDECRRWFFAVVDHQAYCSDECRKRHASRSDDFKERRRLYMREYRLNEKRRDLEDRGRLRRENRDQDRAK